MLTAPREEISKTTDAAPSAQRSVVAWPGALAGSLFVCLLAVLPLAVTVLAVALVGIWAPVAINHETFGVHYTAYPTFALGYQLVGNAMAFDVVYAYLPSYVTHIWLGQFREFDRFQWWWYGVVAIHGMLLLIVAWWLSRTPLPLLAKSCLVLVTAALPLYLSTGYAPFLTINYHLIEAVLYLVVAGAWTLTLHRHLSPGPRFAALAGVLVALAFWTKFSLLITIGSFYGLLLFVGGYRGLLTRIAVAAGSFGLASLLLAWIYFAGHLEYVPTFLADVRTMYSDDFLTQQYPPLVAELTDLANPASAFHRLLYLWAATMLIALTWTLYRPSRPRVVLMVGSLAVSAFFVSFLRQRAAPNTFVDVIVYLSFTIGVWLADWASVPRVRLVAAGLLGMYLWLTASVVWSFLDEGDPARWLSDLHLAGTVAREVDDDVLSRPADLPIVYYWRSSTVPGWRGWVNAIYPSTFFYEMFSGRQDARQPYVQRYAPRSSLREPSFDGIQPGPHIMVVPEFRTAGYVDGTLPGLEDDITFGISPAFDDVLADPASTCVRHRIVNGSAEYLSASYRLVTVCTVTSDRSYRGEADTAPPTGTTDLALGASARAGGGTIVTSPSFVTDGIPDGDATRSPVTMIQSGWQPWIDVDLGAVRNVDALLIWPRSDPCCSTEARDILVLTSADPLPSPDPEAVRAVPGLQSRFISGAIGSPTRINVGAPVRYVRVQAVGGPVLSIAEIQAWGLRDTPERPARPRNARPQPTPRP